MTEKLTYNIKYYQSLIDNTSRELELLKQKTDYDNTYVIAEPYMKKDLLFINKSGMNIDASTSSIIESFRELRKTKSKSQRKKIVEELNLKCNIMTSDIDKFMVGLHELETLKILNEKFSNQIVSDINSDIRERFDIGSIGNKVRDAVVSPIQNVANNIGSNIKNAVGSSVGQITSKFDSVKNSVTSGINSVGSTVTGTVNTLKSQVNSTVNTVRSGVQNVINETSRIAKEIPKQATMITQMVGSKIKEEFAKIQEFFKRFVSEITRIFNLITEKFKQMINEIVKISKMIAQFGENFYNKYLKPIFMEMFGVMKEVFKFIWNEVIPLLRRLIVFIVKELPILMKKFYEIMKRFSINLYNTSFISGLLVIVVFVGLQVYMKHLLDTEMTVPHILLIFFTLSILWDQVMNNTKRMISLQKSIISGIVWFFSLGPVKNMFGLSENFGKDILKSFVELASVYAKNSTKFIVGLLIFLVLFKALGSKLINWGSQKVEQLYNSAVERITS
jgi:phage-related protein